MLFVADACGILGRIGNHDHFSLQRICGIRMPEATTSESTDEPAKDPARLYSFARRARVLVRGRHAVCNARKRIQFVLVTTDISARSRREIVGQCKGIPMIEYMCTDEVERHFGMENTRIVGFLKSPIGKSLMDELSAHRFQ